MTEHEQPAEREEPDVEAHREKFFGETEDAEAPEDLGELREGGDGADEPDVVAHRKKFH